MGHLGEGRCEREKRCEREVVSAGAQALIRARSFGRGVALSSLRWYNRDNRLCLG